MVSKVQINKAFTGDRNTRYFQLIASGKHRKTKIFQLEQDGKIIKGEENFKKHITSYYKTLFGSFGGNDFSLDESYIEDIPKVSAEENIILSAHFTEKEVRDAIFQMKRNKAPGPDGFPAEFTKNFGDSLKESC